MIFFLTEKKKKLFRKKNNKRKTPTKSQKKKNLPLYILREKQKISQKFIQLKTKSFQSKIKARLNAIL